MYTFIPYALLYFKNIPQFYSHNQVILLTVCRNLSVFSSGLDKFCRTVV